MSTIYLRTRAAKVDGKWQPDQTAPWQRIPLGVGKPPQFVLAAEKNGGGFVYRLPNGGWSQPFQTRAEAQRDADKEAKETKQAGSSPTEESSADGSPTLRTAVDDFINGCIAAKRRKRTLQQYELHLNEFVHGLPRNILTVKQATTKSVLTNYMASLTRQGYSSKTIVNRLTNIATLLNSYAKETGVDEPLKLVTLPKVDKKKAKAYSKKEMAKLYSVMTPDEYLRFRFFHVSGAREQEVQFSSWENIDWTSKTFTVTGEGKEDVWEGPKNHEERTVPLPDEMIELLSKARRAAGAHERWIFTNTERNPEGHFLREFKEIAQRAKLNCGRCRSRQTVGSGKNRREVELSCADEPVCEKHYLHRLRKTYATDLLHAGIDLMKIMKWLGHGSLAVTQQYLSDEMQGDEQARMSSVFRVA
ncbi:MAG TPA: site-specific integrase [Candidatus Acidoferrales bacterium]|nr:site-specific integrase [Candidatus Acidoferrales bacterium]